MEPASLFELESLDFENSERAALGLGGSQLDLFCGNVNSIRSGKKDVVELCSHLEQRQSS